MTIDRSTHDHGLHDVIERRDDAATRAARENTPFRPQDLAAVHLAELIPQRVDGSLQGNIQYWLENGNDHLRQGQSKHGGNNYFWDGEELKRRFCKP